MDELVMLLDIRNRITQLRRRLRSARGEERIALQQQITALQAQYNAIRTAYLDRSVAEAQLFAQRLITSMAPSPLPIAAPAPVSVTPTAIQQALSRAGLKIRPELAARLAQQIQAERAAAQAAAQQAAAAAEKAITPGATAEQIAQAAKQAAQAASKAAKRAPWTKEASEKWLEIYRANIEQAAKRTEEMRKDRIAKTVLGTAGTLAGIYGASTILYNAFAGNLDSARLIEYGKMRNASDEANRALREREVALREKEYQLRLAQFLRQMGYVQSYNQARNIIATMTPEQLYALEQAKHYWTMQRGAMAAQAELAKIREAAQWQDWERAREHARDVELEKLKGQIKQALQEGKYRWEDWLERLRQYGEERQIVLKATYDAWKEYLDDLRDHYARMTETYMKAALEDELNRRATIYKMTQEAQKAQVEVAKTAALERIKYYWERKRDFVKAIRDHARFTQIDASRLWELWRKELVKAKKAIAKGEPFLAAVQVPDSPIPVLLKVDPSQPGKLTIVTPEGKSVTI